MKPKLALLCLPLALLVCALVAPSPAHASRTPPIASYTIAVTLDADAKTLTAHQTLTYTNPTDTPIPDLVFHLYLNAFRDETSLFLQEAGPQHRGFFWDAAHPGWIEVTDLRLADGTPLTLEPLEDGTLARAELPTPIRPGETIDLALDFRAQLPRVFARTGYADDFFLVGQWFPKLGVWEDGAWNAHPFHANAEFYADFGTYDVAITLPADYVTAGTGTRTAGTDHGNGTQTVHYAAEDVIDFVWAASPHFREAVRTVDGVDVAYVYLPEHRWAVDRALDAAEAAVSHYGRWYGPYPYPRLTVLDVPDNAQAAGGMEYPTLVTAGTASALGLNPLARGGLDRSLEAVIIHEIGHQWWQSMVAFNEAEEPWLDEGFTDYSTTRVMNALYGTHTSFLDAGNLEFGYRDLHRAMYLTGPRLPMIGPAWSFDMLNYSIATYSKPVLSFSTLEAVLGEAAMLEVMRTFFTRYQFAHPDTQDFRAVAEEVSAQDLGWFFDGLVYGDGVINVAITALDAHSVTVARQGDLRLPTEVRVTFDDGSSVIEPWDGEPREVTFTYPDRAPIQSAQVDPDGDLLLDLVWSDNGRTRRPDLVSWLAVVTRLLGRFQNA
ncbi:MAG: M1 family metallopeptidase, partial [Sedimentisphaerales bacterium]|nr:M1 family metallopeptidase [Sedimentisphaerales bacterium]